MGDTMEYVALTGMSERVIYAVKHHRLLTIEIKSPHNFVAALNLGVGDLLLLTHTSHDDVTSGSSGIVAKVKHQVSTQRTTQTTEQYCEERESISLRIQLDPRCVARVSKVINNKIGEPTVVVADEVPLYNAH